MHNVTMNVTSNATTSNVSLIPSMPTSAPTVEIITSAPTPPVAADPPLDVDSFPKCPKGTFGQKVVKTWDDGNSISIVLQCTNCAAGKNSFQEGLAECPGRCACTIGASLFIVDVDRLRRWSI